jgi:hypothetical protein
MVPSFQAIEGHSLLVLLWPDALALLEGHGFPAEAGH